MGTRFNSQKEIEYDFMAYNKKSDTCVDDKENKLRNE